MRSKVGAVAALLIVTACSPETAPDTTATPTTTLPDGPIRGVLPDGTVYDVILEPVVHEEVTEVTAGVVEAGEVRQIIFTRSDREWRTEPGLEVTTYLGLPMVDLPPSLEWADDEQVPMQVTYETFAVRRGCDETAAACNPTEAVQAVPLPTWSAEDVEVVSYALRRSDHPEYLDPGPLPGRSGHDVMWTGEEMIIWGGSAPPRVEGAAFDPATNTWRMLPSPPLEADQPTRAVWAGTEMVVLAGEATVAYRPESDEWTRIGDGVAPPDGPGGVVWTGQQVMAGTEEGLRALTGGSWTALGDAPDHGVLRVMEGRLFAVGPHACDQRTIREWTGEEWVEVVSLPDDVEECPEPQQVAALAGRFVTWGDEDDATLVYDLEVGRWEESEPVPLPAIDRPSGPVLLDDRFLVPRGDDAAIFDPATREWEPVDLPGYGTDATMVWTGQEVMMWDRCCYEPDDVDAWRWTPPPG